MAYESNESGRYEVYIQSIPPSGAKWQVSIDGGNEPMWRKDGKELYFVADQKLMAAGIRNTAWGIEAGTPETLFEGVRIADYVTSYQPAPDGQRILANLPAAGEPHWRRRSRSCWNGRPGLKK